MNCCQQFLFSGINRDCINSFFKLGTSGMGEFFQRSRCAHINTPKAFWHYLTSIEG